MPPSDTPAHRAATGLAAAAASPPAAEAVGGRAERERAHRRRAVSQSQLAARSVRARRAARAGATDEWAWLVGAVPSSSASGFVSSGVAAAGTVTRRRSRDVQRLVTYGIFGWVRNPLYVGNFLIWMGFVVISGVLWFLPVAIVLFAVEYTLIVRYEEGVLESIFGQEYLDYKKTTPRWFPRPPRSAKRAARLGRSVAKRDQHVLAVRRADLAFAIKQRLWWQ